MTLTTSSGLVANFNDLHPPGLNAALMPHLGQRPITDPQLRHEKSCTPMRHTVFLRQGAKVTAIYRSRPGMRAWPAWSSSNTFVTEDSR